MSIDSRNEIFITAIISPTTIEKLTNNQPPPIITETEGVNSSHSSILSVFFMLKTEKWIKKNFEKKIHMSKFESKPFRLVRFWNKKFTTHQILSEKFYNASDFEIKLLQSVWVWINFFCNVSDFDIKFILKFLHRKNYFSIFLPSKRQILQYVCFFKTHNSDGNFFKGTLNLKFNSWSDFESNFFVRFCIKVLTTCGIWNKFCTTCETWRIKYLILEGKIFPKSIAIVFRVVFRLKSNSSYSLQFPHPNTSSNSRSNKNLCTHFHKEFWCSFNSAVPLLPEYARELCRNWLPIKVLKKLKLSFLSHIWPVMKWIVLVVEHFNQLWTILHTQTLNLFKQSCISKFLHIFNPSSKRTSSEQPGRFSGTLRHWSYWSRVLFVYFFIQHNGIFGW